MSSSWPDVPAIVDNETILNADGLGSITEALTERTEQLKSLIGTQHENAIIINDSGMSNVHVGELVYFNTATGSYAQAQPISADTTAILPSSTAYIAGMVYGEPTADGNGKLLVNGVVTAASVGLENGVAGPYYLGADGIPVLSPPIGTIAIYCGYLTTTKWFIFNPAAPSTHTNDQTIAAPIASIIPSNGITASSSTGTRTVTLGTSFSSGSTITSGGSVIAGIAGATLTYATVVNEIIGGTGTTANTSDGVCTITATGISPYIDLQTINANNTLIGGGINDSLITFPAGITSTLVGLIRLPAAFSEVRLFAWSTNSGDGLTGVKASIVPLLQGVAQTNITDIEFTGTGYEFFTEALVGLSGNELLKIVFEATNPATPISISALGAYVTA